jgi:uncharacterized membrane protein
MHTTHSRTAKSARRKFSLTLLGALVVIAAASIAVFAIEPGPSFYISASPSSQTVAQGQTATYSIALDRQNKFDQPVALSVSNLPANVDIDFSPGPIPGSGSASTLTIDTDIGGTTPTGTRTLTITGTGAGVTKTTTVSLTVTPATQPGYTLVGTPSSRWVTESDSASYTMIITRNGGFTGPVALAASGLPTGASAVFTYPTTDTAALTITTGSNVKPGSYPILISGVGQHGSTQIKRSATVTLSVEEKKAMSIQGDAPPGLSPGAELPMDLALSNKHNFDIKVREVVVALDPHSNTPTCSVEENFAVEQMSIGSEPLILPRDSTMTLSELGVDEADMPQAKMHNLATNQDGCKGVQVYFQYSGLATKP